MKTLLIAPLILLVALSGCSSALQAIATAENAVPQAVTIVANTSTSLVNQGSMTPAEGAKIAQILTDIINANTRAVAATRAITTLDATSKSTIAGIVSPIILEIQQSITAGDVFQIQNAQAKLAITTALTALSATLQIIQAKVA